MALLRLVQIYFINFMLFFYEKNAFIRNKLNLADYIYAFSSNTQFLEDDNVGNLAIELELTCLSNNGKYEEIPLNPDPTEPPFCQQSSS